jgi:hypothetical protein
MDDGELRSILGTEIYQALGQDGGRLSHERRRLLDFYEGGKLGNEVEGRSQVVSRNVFEAVEWTLPAVLDPFVSTEKLCEIEPFRPGDEPMARAATDYINYIINHDNRKYQFLRDWFRDALIQKNGYIQVYYKPGESEVNEYTGLNDQEYQALIEEGDVEVLEESAYPNPDPQAQFFTLDDPNPQFPTLHDIKLRVWQKEGRIQIDNIAPEEMLVSRRAPTTALDGRHFVCRRIFKRVSDLRELDYDEELIEEAVGEQEFEFNSERVSRFLKDDDWPLADDRTDPAMREIILEESYLKVDFDNDGIAELRRIVSARHGSVIFENEPADDVPFIAITPIPLAHKHIGMSLAETVVDLQEIKSTLWRQSLDLIYLSTMPRVIVDEMAATDETFTDLLNPTIGSPIRVANKEGIGTLEIPTTALGAVVPMMELIDHQQEVRTGVANQNMTLSPDDLNKYASGTAINLAQQAASQRTEHFARNFAEGVRSLCEKILGLVIRHQQKEREILITGQWLRFDPREWKSNLKVDVVVGLGTGSRDQVLQHLGLMGQLQEKIVQAQKGFGGPLVTSQNIYSLALEVARNAGLSNGESFFTNPAQAQQPQQGGQPQQNPELVKAQSEAQAMQLRAQTEAQIAQQKAQQQAQLAAQEHQQKMQQLVEQHQLDLQLQREREAAKAQLEQARLIAQQRSNPAGYVGGNGGGLI